MCRPGPKMCPGERGASARWGRLSGPGRQRGHVGVVKEHLDTLTVGEDQRLGAEAGHRVGGAEVPVESWLDDGPHVRVDLGLVHGCPGFGIRNVSATPGVFSPSQPGSAKEA